MANWKRFLIAVNGTEAATKALSYYGTISGSNQDIELFLLYIYPEPPPNYYQSGKSLPDYQQEKEEKANSIFEQSKNTLVQYGIAPDTIQTMCMMAENKTTGQVILDYRATEDCGTVIVGKRGVSKAEEFLFGSISSNLVHQSNNFAVWVIG